MLPILNYQCAGFFFIVDCYFTFNLQWQKFQITLIVNIIIRRKLVIIQYKRKKKSLILKIEKCLKMNAIFIKQTINQYKQICSFNIIIDLVI